MRDNELIALIIKTITDQEAVAGISGTPIKQAFQPTNQGPDTKKAGYMFKVGDYRRGTPQKSDVWDVIAGKMIHTETQVYETTFQISALSTQNPADTVQYTASDIVNLIAYILQSASTVEILQAAGVGVLRVGDVRNPYFTDDRERFEAEPSFDFVLTHKQIVASENKVLSSNELEIYPV